MLPIVNGLESEFENQIAFLRVDANTEEGRATMLGYGLRGHPSYAIIGEDGALHWTAIGQLPAALLRQSLIEHGNLQ
jgi:hypothetical protein